MNASHAHDAKYMHRREGRFSIAIVRLHAQKFVLANEEEILIIDCERVILYSCSGRLPSPDEQLENMNNVLNFNF